MRIRMHASLLGAALLATAGVAAGVRARAHPPPVRAGATALARIAPLAAAAPLPGERVGAPAPLEPASGASVEGPPALAWRLPAGVDGAVVELGPTPDLEGSMVIRYFVRGDRLALPEVPGVWYWRVRGRSGDVEGDRASSTWSFSVAERPGRPRPRALAPSAMDEPDWANPYDLLMRGIAPGASRDMR